MTTNNIKEFRKLSPEEIDDNIINISKELLYLKIQKATRQNIKPHLFKYYRRQLAQLLTIKSNATQ